MKSQLIAIVAAVLVVGCGEPSLYEAIAKGNARAVKQHLADGTDVNAGDPLLYAASWGHKESPLIVELLIAKGADVNAKTDYSGETPLHNAAFGYKEVAEVLIAAGADVDAMDDDGRTPLHEAVLKRRKEIAELFLAKGADVNAMDDDGETPLDYAVRYNSETEIADILRKHGGKTAATSPADLERQERRREPVKQTSTRSNAKNTMGDWLKKSIQEELNQRHSQLPAATFFDVAMKPKVLDVTVVRAGLFSHKGIAKIQYKGRLHNVVVTITTDGKNSMWEAPLGSFLFLAL